MQRNGFEPEAQRMGKGDWKFWLAIAIVVATAYLGAYWLFAPT